MASLSRLTPVLFGIALTLAGARPALADELTLDQVLAIMARPDLDQAGLMGHIEKVRPSLAPLWDSMHLRESYTLDASDPNVPKILDGQPMIRDLEGDFWSVTGRGELGRRKRGDYEIPRLEVDCQHFSAELARRFSEETQPEITTEFHDRIERKGPDPIVNALWEAIRKVAPLPVDLRGVLICTFIEVEDRTPQQGPFSLVEDQVSAAFTSVVNLEPEIRTGKGGGRIEGLTATGGPSNGSSEIRFIEIKRGIPVGEGMQFRRWQVVSFDLLASS